MRDELAAKSKRCNDLNIRNELLAMMTGRSKTIAAVKYKAWRNLQDYVKWKKLRRRILSQRVRHHNSVWLKQLFQGWQKHYRGWRKNKDKEDYEQKLKSEVAQICTQYNKEIEMLRN